LLLLLLLLTVVIAVIVVIRGITATQTRDQDEFILNGSSPQLLQPVVVEVAETVLIK
jgi:hypothetical protein